MRANRRNTMAALLKTQELFNILAEVEDGCVNKSTEYVIQRLKDEVTRFNKVSDTCFDPHKTAIEQLRQGATLK